MSIDTSGEWWVGSEPADVQGFLEAYADASYKVHEFRLARCKCGSDAFRLEADDTEGVARRTCAKCSQPHFICDSAEHWDDAEPAVWKCIECSSDHTNVGVGFSLRKKGGEIKWVYIGCRCAKCGILGCFAGWKIDYAPSRQLLDQA